MVVGHTGGIHKGQVLAAQRRHVQAPAALAPEKAGRVDRRVVQPRVQHVQLARRGVELHVRDEGLVARNVVSDSRAAAAVQPVRAHDRLAGAAGRGGAQVRHAPAGVDLQVRCSRTGGRAPDRPGRVVLAGRGRDGVDHPLQLRGGAPLYHVHVGPLLRRGVYRAVLAYLDRDRFVGQRGGSQEGATRRVVRYHARVGVVPDDRVEYPGLFV